MSWVLFLIIFVITILQWREQKKNGKISSNHFH